MVKICRKLEVRFGGMNKELVLKIIKSKYFFLSLASSIVTLWVLFSFSTAALNFDAVGQQILTRQWLSGAMDGAGIGQTNYIVKMLFVYAPAEILGLNPKIFLFASTIAINIITLVGLSFLLEKIIKYFTKKELGSNFWLSSVWIASIAGSVFWIQFTNSRNLEVVAGVAIIYLGLVLYQKMNQRQLLWLILLSGLTFFTDPMQFFVSGAILVGYLLVDVLLCRSDARKAKFKNALIISVIIALGYLLSLGLKWLFEISFNLTFASVIKPDFMQILQHPNIALMETVRNFYRLLSGTTELGRWKAFFNLVVFSVMLVTAILLFAKNKQLRQLKIFLLVWVSVCLGVFVVSGQALVTDQNTSRYLIMIFPAIVILFGVLNSRTIFVLMSVLVLVNTSSLILGIAKHGIGISNEAYLRSKYQYLAESNFSYGYADYDSALPANFLFASKKHILLPVNCDYGRVSRIDWFYDKKGYELIPDGDQELVPIILDGYDLGLGEVSCDINIIKSQLGQPVSIQSYGGDQILIYRAREIRDYLADN